MVHASFFIAHCPPPISCPGVSPSSASVSVNSALSAASALTPFPSMDFQLSTFGLSRKLSLLPSRTYLQEPALRRPGGIQSCRTVTGVSSPGPLSSPPLFSSFRRWPSWRNPPPPRQAPPNQRH